MIYLVGGNKTPGTGKTTIALHLAIWLSQQRHTVILIETDSNGPIHLFTRNREKYFNGNAGYETKKLALKDVAKELSVLVKEFTDIIVDLDSKGELAEALELFNSDVIIIPFLPWAFSIPSTDSFVASLEALSTKIGNFLILPFINMANQPRSAEKAVKKLLADNQQLTPLNSSLGKSHSYKEAASKGFSIIELPNPDQKACTDLHLFFMEIQQMLKEHPGQTKMAEEVSKEKVKDVIPAAVLKMETPRLKETFARMNVTLTREELDMIKTLREARPNSSRSKTKRPAISTHDWIVEAIQEKINREYPPLKTR